MTTEGVPEGTCSGIPLTGCIAEVPLLSRLKRSQSKKTTKRAIAALVLRLRGILGSIFCRGMYLAAVEFFRGGYARCIVTMAG